MLFYRLESLNFLIRQLANSPIRQLSSYKIQIRMCLNKTIPRFIKLKNTFWQNMSKNLYLLGGLTNFVVFSK